MRIAALLVPCVAGVMCAACSKGPFHAPDAALPSDAHDGSAHDAAPDALSPDAPDMCSGLVQIPLAVHQIDDVASDGTTLFVSVVTASDAIELQTLPLSGAGTPTTIASAATGSFHLTNLGDAVFYAAQLTAGTYELHQLVGASDTLLGSIGSTAPPQLAANATDLYVLGGDASQTTLWRAPRSGSGVTPASSSAPSPGSSRGLALGTTLAAWWSGSLALTVIPGPTTSQVIAESGNVAGVALHGDTGYVLHDTLVTSHTIEQRIDQFTPTDALVWREDVSSTTSGIASRLFGDDRYLYYTTAALTWLAFDGSQGGTESNFDPGTRGQQDATHILGITNGAQPMVNVVAKP